MELTGKVVVVTGAASGIGRAMARRFASEQPAALVLADRDAAGLDAVAAELDGAETLRCNVADEEEIAALVSTVEQRHGAIDLYCGNAGILRYGGVETPAEDLREVIDVNVLSHVYAARAALPGMVRRGNGYFLITASAAGLLTQLGSLSYSISKHAAVSLAEWIAVSYGHLGIKVSALCPQAVETAMTADGSSVAGIDGMLPADTVAELVVEGLRNEQFLILPHPEVRQYFLNKATDYDRWIGGMKKLQRRFPELEPRFPAGGSTA